MRNNLPLDLFRNSYIFVEEIALETVVCVIAPKSVGLDELKYTKNAGILTLLVREEVNKILLYKIIKKFKFVFVWLCFLVIYNNGAKCV